MLKIEAGKKYRTRGGDEVEILKTGINFINPVIGVVTHKETGGQSVLTLEENGSYFGGQQCRFDLISEITSEEGGDYPFSIEIVEGPDKGLVREVREYTDLPRGKAFRILPTKPPKRVVWLNVYPDESSGFFYNSRQGADHQADSARIACIRVEFEEGQFDE